jgi:hypothetical protein
MVQLYAAAAAVAAFLATSAAHAISVPDFNGDGRADIAFQARRSTFSSTGAGLVCVMYGSGSNNTSFTAGPCFNQSTPGVEDNAEAGDDFGGALAWGNFNNDAFHDLVVGVPGESINGFTGAGAIHTFLGGPNGLDLVNDGFLHRGIAGIEGEPDTETGALPGDRFGMFVAVLDYNGDGFDDLAVSAPFDEHPTPGGTVQIFPGGSNPLSIFADFISSNGVAESNFGWDLTAADFNCDGFDDLAVGAWKMSVVSGFRQHGQVYVSYGGANGFFPFPQVWNQDTPGVQGVAEAGNSFGYRLHAGNFNGDTASGFECADLVISAPFDDVGSANAAGSVTVLYGGTSLLTSTGNAFFTQANGGLGETPENNDRFGYSISSMRASSDAIDDLIIGVPGEKFTATCAEGGVHVLPGTSSGVTSAGSAFLRQGSGGVAETSEACDAFGDAVGGTHRSLLVGVPGESVGSANGTGAVISIAMTGSSNITVTSSTARTLSNFGITPATSDLIGSEITRPRP